MGAPAWLTVLVALVSSGGGVAVGWPPKRLDRLDRTVGFHHHTQRGSPMRHPVREEPHG